MRFPGGGRGMVLAAAVAAYLLTGLFTVRRDEQAAVLLVGIPWKNHVPPGIHYAPPWPFGEREVVRTATAYQMSVGYKIADALRGVPPTPAEVEFLTGDTNILDIELLLQYTIEDPLAFSRLVEDPHFLVRRAAEAVATRILARTGVDEVLTYGRSSFLEEVRRGTEALLGDYGAGITIVSSTLKRIEPPGEVVAAFQDVQNAKSDRERTINEATGYKNEILPRASGEAEALQRVADGARLARVEEARGETARCLRLLAAYREAPRATEKRMYLETVERILGLAKIYVIDSDGGRKPTRIKLIE